MREWAGNCLSPESPPVKASQTPVIIDTKSSQPGTSQNNYWPIGPTFGLLFINSILCGMLLAASVLREIPEFWMNKGGYPVLLRECVYWLFYPCLAVCFSGIVGSAWISLKMRQRNAGGSQWVMNFCGLQVLLFMAVLMIALWDNLNNLANGRPIFDDSISDSPADDGSMKPEE